MPSAATSTVGGRSQSDRRDRPPYSVAAPLDTGCAGSSCTPTVFTFTNSRMPCARELAAVAGALHAAERQPRVGRDHGVDERPCRPRARRRSGRRSAASFVQTLRAEAERRRRWRAAIASSTVRTRNSAGDRAEDLLAVRPATPAGRRRARSARRSSPARRRRLPPVSTRAPAATVALHLLVELVERSARVASGPTSVAGSIGSPTCSAAIARDEAPLELVGDRARATMKRLAAMQDWPLLMRARLDRRRRPRRRGRRSASR